MTAECLEFQATYPENWAVHRAYVDNDGWLVPWRVNAEKSDVDGGPKLTISQEIMSWNNRPGEAKPNPAFFFWAAGVRPPEYNAEAQQFYKDQQAKRLPPIPAWLGEHPPIGTVFVPNGEILTYGELDLHFQPDPRGPMYSNMREGLKWYRYTRDGYLLGTYDLGGRFYDQGDWRNIYADWAAMEAQMRSKGMEVSGWSTSGGYKAYVQREKTDPEDPEAYRFGPKVTRILAAYDYAGNPVDPETTVVGWLTPLATQWPQETIASAYKIQKELGVADTIQSPWLGGEHGPVIVDPAPQLPPRVAYKNSYEQNADGSFKNNSRSIIVKPLDDPGNPYKDKYGAWDYWALEHFGMQNPKWNEMWQAQRKAAEAELKKAKEEKRKPDPKILQREGTIPSDPNDPWKHFDMYVDDNGYVIPKVQQRAQTEQRWRNAYSDYDLRKPIETQLPSESPFTFQAGGEMPKEMEDAMHAAEQAALEPDGIRVPDWLAAAPPRWVIFVPNGEIVTSELGVYDPDEYNKPEAERKKGSGWYRYSADGKLLGHVDGEKVSWQQLYTPQIPALEMSGKSQGYYVDNALGYLIWRKPKDQGGDAVSAWDYDGTPLPLDQPLRRPRGVLRMYQWAEVMWQMKLNKAHGL